MRDDPAQAASCRRIRRYSMLNPTPVTRSRLPFVAIGVWAAILAAIVAVGLVFGGRGANAADNAPAAQRGSHSPPRWQPIQAPGPRPHPARPAHRPTRARPARQGRVRMASPWRGGGPGGPGSGRSRWSRSADSAPSRITAINGSQLSLKTDDGWTRTIDATGATITEQGGTDDHRRRPQGRRPDRLPPDAQRRRHLHGHRDRPDPAAGRRNGQDRRRGQRDADAARRHDEDDRPHVDARPTPSTATAATAADLKVGHARPRHGHGRRRTATSRRRRSTSRRPRSTARSRPRRQHDHDQGRGPAPRVTINVTAPPPTRPAATTRPASPTSPSATSSRPRARSTPTAR